MIDFKLFFFPSILSKVSEDTSVMLAEYQI